MSETLSSGIDQSYFSESVTPAQDLFGFANEGWVKAKPIPEDKARFGVFDELHDAAELAVRQIIQEFQNAPEGSSERKVGDLYASFMDTDRIAALGATPLAPWLAKVREVATKEELFALIGDFQRQGIGGFIGLYVDNDRENTEIYRLFVEQGGLSLPNESYYREAQFAPVVEAFTKHVETMLTLAQIASPEAKAAGILALETKIAAGHWDNVASREATKTYNQKSWSEFTGQWGSNSGLLNLWLEAGKIPSNLVEQLVVRQPSFIEHFGKLIDSTDLESWKNWMEWKVVTSLAAYLSDDFVNANFDFYGRTLSGVPAIRDRWKRAISFTEGVMGEEIGKAYVARFYPAETKAKMDELVKMLVEAYRESITELDWMSAETRQRALEKLDAFTPKIGHPDKWRDYSSLKVTGDDLIANVLASHEFELAYEMKKLAGPVDRGEWHMTPQTINAYYNPGMNEIVFPAAILQAPFFDPNRDAAANYGAIGGVIGHEIGHGFDDQGSRYDGQGRLKDWWTEEDRKAFEERTSVLIDQFNALSPRECPGLFVNGALTIGENIGDLGGLSIAWKAYVLSLNGQEPPVIDGLTGAERFVLSWAQIWKYQSRPAETERLLAIDPHSPPEFRVNQIVKNVDVFYDAFGVTDEDPMWMSPKERVRIW
jgi:putative endopeptidase